MTRRRPARRVIALMVLLAVLGGGWALIHRTMPSWYARFFYPLHYEHIIKQEAKRYDLDPALVAAVIKQESDWVPDERSQQGAIGLMQLLPSTARFVATQPRRPSPNPDRLDHPDVNIAYGTRYLRYLLDRYATVDAALVAYNGGEQNLIEWTRTAAAAGHAFRIPEDVPFTQTRDFVRGVRKSELIYRRAYAGRLRLG